MPSFLFFVAACLVALFFFFYLNFFACSNASTTAHCHCDCEPSALAAPSNRKSLLWANVHGAGSSSANENEPRPRTRTRSHGFRRMCPRMPAPVVPNHQKKRNDVRIVNSPLPPTKPSYGASPAVVPVGLMQKGRLKSTQKSPN